MGRSFIDRILPVLVGLLAGLSTNAGAETNIVYGGFADVQSTATDHSGRGSNAFSLGQYDSYISGKVDDNVMFLSEVVFEYDQDWRLDVERLWLNYNVHQAFTVSAGKFHTPLGFWNRTYHHGALLHTSVDRPLCLRFEDEGGILPIHIVGVMLSGEDIGRAQLAYDVVVGNGVGGSPATDNDNNKAVSGYIRSRVIEGVEFGGSFYVDRLSRGAVLDAHVDETGEPIPLEEDIDQLILGATVAIERSGFELLSEYLAVSNKGRTTDATGDNTGFYTLVSYAPGRLQPYVRYDRLETVAGDPYFSPGKTNAATGGVRYNISQGAALKLQYSYVDTQGTSPGNVVRTQFAVGF